MPELAQIFRTCGTEYYQKYGNNMLPSHKRALHDVAACRTEIMGGSVYFCTQCQDYRYSYHSCKNRSCPKCGNNDTTRWIEKQSHRLLPVRYFFVTVTLPDTLRTFARKNQKLFYGLLMRCGANAIQKLAQDPKFIGGQPGIIAVLQTWKRDMQFHPHVHFIVSGGGWQPDTQTWKPVQRDYLMPHKALAKIFRAKFRDAIKKQAPKLFTQIPPEVWLIDWVIDIRPVGTGKTALKYLAPYIFRVAISNKRIANFENGMVTFRYQDNKGKWHTQTLDAEKFISRFLQHVLPQRFVKVRYYGIFGTRKHHILQHIKELFHLAADKVEQTTTSYSTVTDDSVMRCPKCGSEMIFIRIILPIKTRAP